MDLGRPRLCVRESDVIREGGMERVLRWERAAQTRWGQYLTESERDALQLAMTLADSPTTALDAGCGTGRWSRRLLDAGWSVVCADVDAEALAVCRARMPDVTCLEMRDDAHEFPIEAASIGLFVVIEVGPLVEQPWFASEAARVLSPDGALVCTYYNSRSLRGLAYRLLAAPTATTMVRPSPSSRGSSRPLGLSSCTPRALRGSRLGERATRD